MSPVAWIFILMGTVCAVFALMFYLQVRRVRSDLVQSEARGVGAWVKKTSADLAETEDNRTEGEAWDRFKSHTGGGDE